MTQQVEYSNGDAAYPGVSAQAGILQLCMGE
jgi:hypothetical protein